MNDFARKWSPRAPLGFLLAISWQVVSAAPQIPAAEPRPGPEGDLAIAATVDGQPVLAREVERDAARALDGRPATPEAVAVLRAQTLQHLVDRRLIVRRLERRKLGASSQDIELAVARLQEQQLRQGRSWAEYLQMTSMGEAELRREIAWRLGWQRYLQRYLTDENLKTYFDRHRRDFDGGQVRVAHILFKVESTSGGQPPHQTLEPVLKRAERIREKIVAGELAFDEAASQFSEAPSSADGGRVGFISRHEPMPEAFSRAAFALEVGDISEPVVSPFGVHLILCGEVKPGEKNWTDVRTELETAAAEYLFQWLADRERPEVEIRFTGECPYFKPGTKELIDKDRHAEP